MSRSAHRMPPWATAGRTASGAVTRALLSASAALVPLMRPNATAAAEATSGSEELSCLMRGLTALGSRRTAMELITPTSTRPWTLSRAWRRAAAASGPGMDSKAMRAQEVSSGSVSKGSRAGTASLPPKMASFLQARALSALGPSDLRRVTSSRTCSGEQLWLSAAAAEVGLAARRRDSAARQDTINVERRRF